MTVQMAHKVPLPRKALRRAVEQVRYVSVVPPGSAGGLVADVYEQVERDFGMLAPPVALHSAAARPLAASWMMLRETLVAHGVASRAAKEAVAAAVSRSNACPYCVTVHNAVLGGLDRRREAAAIAAAQADLIDDPLLRAITSWAMASGRPDPAAGAPPVGAQEFAELAGVAVTFQYLNRMVTIFLADTPLPAVLPAPVTGGMLRVLGRMLKATARTGPQPGASLGLLPQPPQSPRPPQPPAIGWASGRPVIADAFARASAAIEAAGRKVVPQPARELVLAELAGWDGRPRGLSLSWADSALGALTAADRPAGRLVLLAALAPHQIGQEDIDEFRRSAGGDAELIEAASWASLAAALRIGSWLAPATV